MKTATAPAQFASTRAGLEKTPTGIAGLDEITGGGLPTGRPTLVTGSAGCGKTLLGIEFLVHGAVDLGEPGVLLAFEESAADLAANVRSLGIDLDRLERDGLLVVDAFRVDPAEIVETGSYDLEGLFIRLACAVESIGAKRVVLDTIEVLFGALQDSSIVRSEIGRLFRWMKDRGLTAVVTGERGPGVDGLTRHGIEEYISDCVIVLDHRVHDELSTRRLRIVKYRGSLHGTNEYPFLITEDGVAVLPLTSLGLAHRASTERVSTGVERLDYMLGGGLFRGSSTLITGEAGTGKTTLAAKVVETACRRGERALLVSFEESPAQLVRNMASVGMDLQKWLDAGLLQIWAGRPSAYGLELHLATLMRAVDEFAPTTVALDAMTALEHVGDVDQVTSTITREIDLLKTREITTVATSLTRATGSAGGETSSVFVTSMMDTWLLLRNVEDGGERNRLLFIRKSRGSSHSNQVREFTLTDDGPDLVDVYRGPNGVLAGSARLIQEAEDERVAVTAREELDRQARVLAARTEDVEEQIATLRRHLDAATAEYERSRAAYERATDVAGIATRALAAHRWADAAGSTPRGGTS